MPEGATRPLLIGELLARAMAPSDQLRAGAVAVPLFKRGAAPVARGVEGVGSDPNLDAALADPQPEPGPAAGATGPTAAGADAEGAGAWCDRTADDAGSGAGLREGRAPVIRDREG